jgi:hypothetical protein
VAEGDQVRTTKLSERNRDMRYSKLDLKYLWKVVLRDILVVLINIRLQKEIMVGHLRLTENSLPTHGSCISRRSETKTRLGHDHVQLT